jgi:hypothetical protein
MLCRNINFVHKWTFRGFGRIFYGSHAAALFPGPPTARQRPACTTPSPWSNPCVMRFLLPHGILREPGLDAAALQRLRAQQAI